MAQFDEQIVATNETDAWYDDEYEVGEEIYLSLKTEKDAEVAFRNKDDDEYEVTREEFRRLKEEREAEIIAEKHLKDPDEDGQHDDQHKRIVTADELIDRRVELRMALRGAIYELKPELRDVLEHVLDGLANRKLNITALARDLDIPYATLYDRFGKALGEIEEPLKQIPVVWAWFHTQLFNVSTENRVATVLDVFREERGHEEEEDRDRQKRQRNEEKKALKELAETIPIGAGWDVE